MQFGGALPSTASCVATSAQQPRVPLKEFPGLLHGNLLPYYLTPNQHVEVLKAWPTDQLKGVRHRMISCSPRMATRATTTLRTARPHATWEALKALVIKLSNIMPLYPDEDCYEGSPVTVDYQEGMCLDPYHGRLYTKIYISKTGPPLFGLVGPHCNQLIQIIYVNSCRTPLQREAYLQHYGGSSRDAGKGYSLQREVRKSPIPAVLIRPP